MYSSAEYSIIRPIFFGNFLGYGFKVNSPATENIPSGRYVDMIQRIARASVVVQSYIWTFIPKLLSKFPKFLLLVYPRSLTILVFSGKSPAVELIVPILNTQHGKAKRLQTSRDHSVFDTWGRWLQLPDQCESPESANSIHHQVSLWPRVSRL